MSNKDRKTPNPTETEIELTDDELDSVQGGVAGSSQPNAGIRRDHKGIHGSSQINAGFDAEKGASKGHT